MKLQKHTYAILISCLLLSVFACTEDKPVAIVAPPPPAKVEKPVKAGPIPPPTKPLKIGEGVGKSNNTLAPQKVLPNFVKCSIKTKTLPNNILEVPVQNITAFITADDSTKDKDYGESHRIFKVKSSPNCEEVFNQTLPVNVSPDFPYYLSKNGCNEKLGLLAVQGFQNALVYDIAAKKISKPLVPKFLTEQEAADASSGMVTNLFFEEHFLLGYAVDFGLFVFDMKKNGSPVLPIVESKMQSGFTRLFALEKEKGKVDLFIPNLKFDDNGTLSIDLKKVIDKSLNINPTLNFKFKNNRYILFKEQLSAGKINHVVIDLQKKERLKIPEAVAQGHMKEVIKLLK